MSSAVWQGYLGICAEEGQLTPVEEPFQTIAGGPSCPTRPQPPSVKQRRKVTSPSCGWRTTLVLRIQRAQSLIAATVLCHQLTPCVPSSQPAKNGMMAALRTPLLLFSSLVVSSVVWISLATFLQGWFRTSAAVTILQLWTMLIRPRIESRRSM